MQRLGERNQLTRGAGGAHATAGDDHRPLGFLQKIERRLHMRGFRLRAERRHLGELRLDDRLHLGFVEIDLPFIAAELQMHRPGRARGRSAEGLADHVGDARDVIDGDVHLGHRLKRRHVVDFLIDLAELGLGIAAAGHGDHRRVRQPGVAQAGREIERADHLRHAHARLAGGAGIAIGHIGRGLLAMGVDAGDLGAALHLGEGPPQHRRHHEDMGDAIARQHVGEHLGTGALLIVAQHHPAFPFPRAA